MVSTITLNAGATNQTSVTLVTMPVRPGFKAIEPGVYDPVSTVVSPWTGQTQRQYYPGGDRWTAKCTLPPMKGTDIDEWEAFILETTGMLNAVQICFPNKLHPRGVVDSRSAPVVNSTVGTNNVFGARTLVTRGWLPNAVNLLQRNDAIQIGYRYYRVLERVTADSGGNATLSIWPSLRERPADGTAIVFSKPKLLCALPNSRTWGLRLPMVMDFSFDLVEYK